MRQIGEAHQAHRDRQSAGDQEQHDAIGKAVEEQFEDTGNRHRLLSNGAAKIVSPVTAHAASRLNVMSKGPFA